MASLKAYVPISLQPESASVFPTFAPLLLLFPIVPASIKMNTSQQIFTTKKLTSVLMSSVMAQKANPLTNLCSVCLFKH